VTYGGAWGRVADGEKFEDPEILRLSDSLGWTIAHVQANRGWTTLDPDILSLTRVDGLTVLDVMLDRGWLPQTEEEKLIVFTVRAGA